MTAQICPVCLLAWVARVAGEPGATGASVLEALGRRGLPRARRDSESIAFETLAYDRGACDWADPDGLQRPLRGPRGAAAQQAARRPALAPPAPQA